jgi:hypothetical protein
MLFKDLVIVVDAQQSTANIPNSSGVLLGFAIPANASSDSSLP